VAEKENAKTAAIKAIRTLIDAARQLSEAEKVLRENPKLLDEKSRRILLGCRHE